LSELHNKRVRCLAWSTRCCHSLKRPISRPLDHPKVLATRINIVAWTDETETGVLQLLQELPPDLGRVLGPNVLTTHGNISFWKAQPVANAEHESEVDPDDLEPEIKTNRS
jgi:hypothetical protein